MIALCLAGTLVFPLVSCAHPAAEEELPGIQIENDAPYSEETLAYAEQTIASLVDYAYRKAVWDTVSEKVAIRLADYATKICRITHEDLVTEAQYRAAIDLLAEKGEAALDEVIVLREEGFGACEQARALYLDWSSIFGSEHVGSMLYDCCLLVYDLKCERVQEKWEEYRYPWYQEELQALRAEKEVFTHSMESKDFSTLIRCSTALAELASVDSAQIADAFSDAEVLDMIRYLDLAEVSIAPDGWELLLSYGFGFGSSSYQKKLCEALRESGDMQRIAERMNDVQALTVAAMNRLTTQDVALLRQGEREAVISAVFSRFDEQDWARFFAATSLSLDNATYSALAREEYGASYEQYLSKRHAIDYDALRAVVGTEDFYPCLLEYLAGICPSLSYEVMV